MNEQLKIFIILTFITVPMIMGQSVDLVNEAEGHRSGCHAAHSCPSDTGSYVCGDTGHGCNEEKKSSSKTSSKSTTNDDDENKNSIKSKSNSKGDAKASSNIKPTLPEPTLSEGIEISGLVTYVVDGDTLDINNIRIRLALVNTPEVGEDDFYAAKNFVEDLCLDKHGEVNIDDGQRQGSFGREIGVVYCDGINLNQELMSNHLAIIDTRFCEESEFATESWANESCSPNARPDNFAVKSDSLPKNEDSISSDMPNTNYEKDYKLVTKWGSFGKGDGQFNHPASIETDQNGQRLYVADLDNNRIQVLDSDGNYITKWGSFGKGDGQFNHPGDVVVDGNNKFVFVADIENNRIQKFDTEGNFITKWGKLGKDDGKFDHPGDMALNPDKGVIYVTDIYNNRVQKFDYDGNLITKWGSFGTKDGQFNRPAGITINPTEEQIYVTDTVNNRIQVFDGDGNFIDIWGSFGSRNGQFNRPDGITFDPSEKLIYVTDRKNNRIQVFDDDGIFVTKWTPSESRSGNPIKPRDIALDSSGQILVADKENSKLLIYNTIGDAVPSIESINEQNDYQGNTNTQELSEYGHPQTRHGKSYFEEIFESDPDDAIYVVSHSTKRQKLLGDLYYTLVGEIKNISDEDVSYVKITATFYDDNDIVIGTDYSYAQPDDLDPGQKAPYDLYISDSNLDVKEIAKAVYSLEWE